MRSDVLTTNFTGGELSPRLHGRPDLAKYADSVKEARDVVVFQHGGITSRPGTDDLGAVDNNAKPARVIPFVYSVSDAYVLELCDGVIRFWRNGALVESSPGVPYTVAHPYADAHLFDVDYTQGADTMLMAHPSYPIKRLRRFADARWVFDDAPFDPAPFDDIGERFGVAVTLGATSGSTTATAGGATWLAADVGRTIDYSGGEATITGYTSSTVVNVTITSAFSTTTLPANQWVLTGSPQTTCAPTDKEPVGKITTLTAGAAAWRAEHVGKFVTINGGLLQITGFTSATAVSARILTAMTSTVAAEADSWTLESPVWNAYDGYPATVTFHEQRTVAASTTKKPQTLWGSKIGLYFDFTKGTTDDAAYSYDLGTDEINPIRFLSSNRDLMALTFGGEWTVSGGIEKPITPTSVRAKLQNRAGADAVRPEQIGDDLYYAQRGQTTLRVLGYRIELQGYASDEASTFSEHLAALGIEAISYQQSPERVAWLQLSDGRYIAMTVSREQQLRAMTLCTPGGGGFVESMATIPEGDEDATYLVVRRTVSGTTTRRVERMRWSAVFDAQKDSTPASATVTGLSHLEGMTVGAVADGVDVGDFTVTGGQITLPRTAAAVKVGLRFTPRVKMLNPETGTGMGASIGRKVMSGQTRVLFKDTVGCSVNGQALAFRRLGEDVLGGPVPAYSGWLEISNIGWGEDVGEIELSQPQAYPWTVLAVVRRMTANPG